MEVEIGSDKEVTRRRQGSDKIDLLRIVNLQLLNLHLEESECTSQKNIGTVILAAQTTV